MKENNFIFSDFGYFVAVVIFVLDLRAVVSMEILLPWPMFFSVAMVVAVVFALVSGIDERPKDEWTVCIGVVGVYLCSLYLSPIIDWLLTYPFEVMKEHPSPELATSILSMGSWLVSVGNPFILMWVFPTLKRRPFLFLGVVQAGLPIFLLIFFIFFSAIFGTLSI